MNPIFSKVEQINQFIPVHSMWDGFWIHSFLKNELTISCSFDRMYYRNFDIIFSNVIFFNLPDEWRDTNVLGDNLIRLADEKEFLQQQPNFDIKGKTIFAIDLYYYPYEKPTITYTFYIVADDLLAEACTEGNSSPAVDYTDRFENEPYPCLKNRVK